MTMDDLLRKMHVDNIVVAKHLGIISEERACDMLCDAWHARAPRTAPAAEIAQEE